MDELKLDKIKDDVNEIKVTLAKIEVTLEQNRAANLSLNAATTPTISNTSGGT